MQLPKKLSKEKQEAFLHAVRQIIGQSILAAGTIAYIVQNLGMVQERFAFVLAAGVVFLLLYFANKR